MSNTPETTKNNSIEKGHHETPRQEEFDNQHHERLRELHEQAGEMSPERNLEHARHEALEKAAAIERQTKETEVEEPQPDRLREGPISKKVRDASYTTTMNEIRTQMTGPSRTFSKVIHNQTIEKVSEAAGNTIARPNSILTGSIFAFSFTLILYLVAKNFGYPLSGFESIGSFILGWIVGLLYDFLKVNDHR